MHGPVGRRGSVDRDETCGTGSCGQPAVTSVGGGIAEDPAGPGGLDLPTPRCPRRIMVQMARDRAGCLCWIAGHRRRSCARLGILEPSARERPWESAHLPPSQIRGEMGDSESVVGLVLAGSLGEAGQVRDSPPHPHHLFPAPLHGWLGQRLGDGRAW